MFTRITILSLTLVFGYGCSESSDAKPDEGEATSKGSEEASETPAEKAGEADSEEEDTKYVLGGKVRPAWIETLKLVNESLDLTLKGKDHHRAVKLALAAVDLAADHPLLLGYMELTVAFAELRRGKAASFERLMVRGLGRVPTNEHHTEIAILAAEQSVRRGRLDPSRQILGLWRKRLAAAGEDKLAQKVEDVARSHLERVRGKPDAPNMKHKFETPPDDFPIVLPN